MANGQAMNERLFMQLMVFDVGAGAHPRRGCQPAPSGSDPEQAGARGVRRRERAAHPRSADLDPGSGRLRQQGAAGVLAEASLVQRPELSMLGRTYSIGHEPDLEHAILKRPIE